MKRTKFNEMGKLLNEKRKILFTLHYDPQTNKYDLEGSIFPNNCINEPDGIMKDFKIGTPKAVIREAFQKHIDKHIGTTEEFEWHIGNYKAFPLGSNWYRVL